MTVVMLLSVSFLVGLGAVVSEVIAADIETVSRSLDVFDEDGLALAEIDEEIEALINKDDSHDSHSPSAKEIMKDWKERRKKDGILIPFQLGQI